MEFKPFSKKQLMLLSWWCNQSVLSHHDAVIADGAIRSGKTLCMSISFISWAFSAFEKSDFAICGKTVTSLRRNVITPLINTLQSLGFYCEEKISKNYIDITYKSRQNRFYLFGGKDEGSAALIQGITLSGIMLDEVALMPRSFVEQALARCSVGGSKFWFNCNPEHPFHWFYQEWIQKSDEKKALYLHFTMEDNPSLTPDILKRYQSLYSGAFYDRFILGKWVLAQGRVYPMFEKKRHVFELPPKSCSQFYISCDYGTVNPTSMGLWGEHNGKWYRLKEYYYSSKEHMIQKTDEEYYQALKELCGNKKIEMVIVDPSAASFITCIRRHGKYKVVPAKNDVISGIRMVADALKAEQILFHSSCKDSIREFSVYSWEESCNGDHPKKENDHAMDDIRYFVNTILHKEDSENFFVLSTPR